MRSINKVILIGNLTRNPEIRQTPNGQSVTTFGLATNREWTTKNGERNNSAEFHECVAWAHLAEICEKYLTKGHLVYIEGYLKTRSWDNPEGIKKFKTEIVVKDMIRLEKRPPGERSPDERPSVDRNEEKNEADFIPEPEATEPEATEPEATEPELVAQGPASENPIEKDLGL